MVLTISANQFEAFATPAKAVWAVDEAQRLHQAYPAYFRALEIEPVNLEPICLAVEKWAATHDLTGERDVSQLCRVATTLGHRFWRDPRFQGYVSGSVGNPELTRAEAVKTLVQDTGDWLSMFWKDDDLVKFAERLVQSLRRDLEPTARVLRDILPGHWRVFDAQVNERLHGWLVSQLPLTRIPAQRLAHVACALAHGTGWTKDPQYALIARTVEAASTSSELADVVSEIYRRIG